MRLLFADNMSEKKVEESIGNDVPKKTEFDRVRLQFDEDTWASALFMNDGTTIPLKIPFHFDEGVPYEIVLMEDFTVEIWRLMSTDNEHKVN